MQNSRLDGVDKVDSRAKKVDEKQVEGGRETDREVEN